MKVLLEMGRFMLEFLVLAGLCGGAVSILGAEGHTWMAATGAFVFTLFLYSRMEWGRELDKKHMLASFGAVLSFVMVMPPNEVVPAHTDVVSYTYGFPFPFLTLRAEEGMSYIGSVISSGTVTGFTMGLGFFLNAALMYGGIFLLGRAGRRERMRDGDLA